MILRDKEAMSGAKTQSSLSASRRHGFIFLGFAYTFLKKYKRKKRRENLAKTE
jgi:hypothetical protein